MKKDFLFRRALELGVCVLLVFLPFKTLSAQSISSLRDGDVGNPPMYIPPHTPIPSGRSLAAEYAYKNGTPESLALIKDDSTLLRDIYAIYGLNWRANSTNQIALKTDMQRRGDAAVSVLVDLFKNPDSVSTPSHILTYLTFNRWIDAERFLPLAREWYAEQKKHYVSYQAKAALLMFFGWAGHPEDEKIMRDLIGDDEPNGSTMNAFLSRFKSLKRP
jgi:hypothetical protein